MMSESMRAHNEPSPAPECLFTLCLGLSIALHVVVLAYVALHQHLGPMVADPVLSVNLVTEKPREPGPPLPAPDVERKSPARNEAAAVAAARPQPELAAPPVTMGETRAAESAASLPAAPATTVEAPPAAAPAAPRNELVPSSVAAGSTPPSFNATYLKNPRPAYPRQALRNGEEGTTILKVLVTRDGLPARVELDKTSGSNALDRAALEAVKVWRFVPARNGEERVEDWVKIPIVFRLLDAS